MARKDTTQIVQMCDTEDKLKVFQFEACSVVCGYNVLTVLW